MNIYIDLYTCSLKSCVGSSLKIKRSKESSLALSVEMNFIPVYIHTYRSTYLSRSKTYTETY